ncbi:S-adenosyl-L-methionine-dependent methyltransferase [Pholiota conissans]|uniref:S-adenosyl-L-methionine-dependent methyltransferase n=1 Tax=Pholiota conissans TaxID=109636 RepID=A0A9P5Z7V6_9AGAR|nr:S-adenosyl-L-methionine-dependent methyltransferase [Pholiota conissans]
MSTFARSTFNATIYSAARPTYPPQLFEYIFKYHRAGASPNKASFERGVDVGCGTGQATEHLRPVFNEVIGVDPSLGMLETARASFANNHSGTGKYSFVQGSGEDLRTAIPEDGSVDLIIAAQAAHWFDWSKVWPETSRVLRKNGTAAFWVYTEFRLANYPTLTPLITAYAQGTDPLNSLGSYFQRPGRTILERYLVDVPEPREDSDLEPLTRAYFCEEGDAPSFLPQHPTILPTLMRTRMRWRDLLTYFRTWSSLHTYHEKYPEDLKRPDDTRFLKEDLESSSGADDELRGGDIAVRFWKDLREGVSELSCDIPVGAEDDVLIEWPVSLLLTRKQ